MYGDLDHVPDEGVELREQFLVREASHVAHGRASRGRPRLQQVDVANGLVRQSDS
jgi:hypothetical protein